MVRMLPLLLLSMSIHHIFFQVLFITPALFYLPSAVLSALIIIAVKSLIDGRLYLTSVEIL
jgi:MFS superfamily sulfate permease-like transporter